MKISKSINEQFGQGKASPEYDEEAVEGMKAMSYEFKVQGNRVYLPLAD
ncbi:MULTISPECIES: hypothetical protein [Streptomyces]|nr:MULTISPECIES: hypothetical protein [Streptomyces]